MQRPNYLLLTERRLASCCTALANWLSQTASASSEKCFYFVFNSIGPGVKLKKSTGTRPKFKQEVKVSESCCRKKSEGKHGRKL